MKTSSNDGKDIFYGLSANEIALLEKIPNFAMRKQAAHLVRIKHKLQFTGWLQYLIPLVFLLLFTLSGGIFLLFNAPIIPSVFFGLASMVSVVMIIDIITVKFRLRLPERVPQKMDHLDFFDLMRARRSCRSFQTVKLRENDYEALMESVRRQSEEPEVKESSIRFEYISAPLTVWPVVNATEFIVAIAPKEYDRISVINVGRYLQKIVIDATCMGIATCWIGPGADHESIAGALGDRFDPDRDHIVCLSAVGYKSAYIPLFLRIFNASMNHRLPLSDLFFSDRELQHSLNLSDKPFKRLERIFEICQWAPSSFNGQTTRAVASTDDEGRIKSFDFFSTTASRYYAAIAVGIWYTNWSDGCEAMGIDGSFAILPVEGDDMELPRYDVSWVPNDGLN